MPSPPVSVTAPTYGTTIQPAGTQAPTASTTSSFLGSFSFGSKGLWTEVLGVCVMLAGGGVAMLALFVLAKDELPGSLGVIGRAL